MHGVTDAPAVDIYANGELLIENLAYGDFQGYLQVPVMMIIHVDITAQDGSTNPGVASFSATIIYIWRSFRNWVYVSGFLSPVETDSALALSFDNSRWLCVKRFLLQSLR